MASGSTPAANSVRRILLVGNGRFDTYVDSFRRALSDHYEVRVADPFDALGSLRRILSQPVASRLEAGITQLAQLFTGEPLALAERNLRRLASEFAPDLALVACGPVLRPAAVASLRSGNSRCRVISVYPDALANFGRGYFFAADYDRLFFKDRYIVDNFRSKLGWRNVHYLPQCCDRSLHRKVPLNETDVRQYGCDLTLAGNPYLYRAESLRPLLERNIRVWGKAPPRWFDHPTARLFEGRYVAGDEKCKAMLAAKIVLNQNHYAEIAGTNKRTFEVAGIGAFQLTDTPALADVFDPESEVAVFDSRDDMLEKIDHYLANPELRTEMAGRAARRAHAEHTYEHRWTAMLETLDLRPPADFPVQPENLALRAQ